MTEPLTKPWTEIVPHIYSPDYQAMGDCRVCGHEQNQPWHLYSCVREDPPMTAIDMTRIELQNAEFDALVALTKAYNNLPPVVDDDYPEMRARYETALRTFMFALEANGRMIRTPR